MRALTISNSSASSSAKPDPAYLKMCEEKAFLLAKIVDGTSRVSLATRSRAKQRLETRCGAKMGPYYTRQLLQPRGFVDDRPLRPGSILQNEELCLHHDDFRNDASAWMEAYEAYAARTKFGVLILAVTTKKFMAWAKSSACRKEVNNIPSGRLFAYIEHADEDEGGRRGYIVSVDPQRDEGAATVSHGQGYILFPNGAYYHGPLKEGLPHTEGDEQGKYTYASGAVYEGGWKEDKYHGKGEKAWADGQVYEGKFEDGEFEGEGKCSYANGLVYDGDWIDGKYHGTGRLTNTDGSVYEGSFDNGHFHGMGKKSAPLWLGINKVEEGMWENGKFLG